MPTIQRSTLHRGPGNLTYDSLTLFSQEDITAAIEIETWRPKISTHGEGAPRIADARGQITFTPAGRITPEIIAALFPAGFRNPTIGARVFPAADKPLSIHGVDGAKLDFVSAALTKMPGLTLSPKGTAFGEAGFTALIGDNKERSAAGSFYTTASAAWSGAFSDAAIIAVPYSGVWGDTAIHTEEGWKIDLEAQIEPIVVDGIGTVDYELTGVTARATCRPVDMTAASLAAALRPEGLNLGTSLRQSKNLVITGLAGGLVVTLYDAVMTAAPAVWGATASRAGEITFEASRKLDGSGTSGTLGAVFEIAIAS